MVRLVEFNCWNLFWLFPRKLPFIFQFSKRYYFLQSCLIERINVAKNLIVDMILKHTRFRLRKIYIHKNLTIVLQKQIRANLI